MFGSSEQTAYFHTLLEKFTQEQSVIVSAAVTEAGEDEPIYAATGFASRVVLLGLFFFSECGRLQS